MMFHVIGVGTHFFSGGAILPKSGVSGYADKGGIVRGGYTDELGMHSAW